MSSSVRIDTESFYKRLSTITSGLKTAEFNSVQTLLVPLGNATDYSVYQKSTVLFTWLLGYEFPETVMLITPTKVAFLTSHKKAQILESIKQESGIEIITLGRDKEANRSAKQFEGLFDLIKAEAGDSAVKVGILGKDKHEGPMVEEWMSYFAGRSGEYESVDVSSCVSTCMSVKDSNELKSMAAAAKTSAVIMKEHVMNKILSIIDEGKKTTHAKLSEDFESVITSQLKKFKTKLPPTLDTESVDICYPPIIQSGGVYSLKPSALSNNDALHFGIILCSLGVRYKSYCSNIGRTFMIDPSKEQEDNFQFLVGLQKHLLQLMRPGCTIASIYEAAHAYTAENRPDLKSHLPANFGFGMGLEFRESDYVINAKNARSLAANQVFNLMVGLQDLPLTEGGKTYALMIADTVQISIDNQGAQLLTGEELKSLNQVSYAVKSEEEQRQARKSRAAQVAAAAEDDYEEGGARRPRTRARTQQKVDEVAELRRREHQRELARQRLAEAKEMYTSQEGANGAGKKGLLEAQKFESYKKDSQWPREQPRSNRILIDDRADTVILPVNGYPVPFHIATIKTVTKTEEGKFMFLRINFVTPGRAFGRGADIEASQGSFMDPQGHFIRSLTVRSSDIGHMQDMFKRIGDLRKAYLARESARKEMSDLVEQASLVEVVGRRPTKLSEVYIRPGLEGRRLPGDVEIHSNGLRYRMQLKGDQKVDILFSNIKHLIFQPCDHEIAVILHIHLKNPIMVGKKKTHDIQFFREALESHVDETGGRRRHNRSAYGDEDEIAQEREERRKRKEANEEFQQFGERIAEAFKGLELEVPFRDLGFDGVPSRQSVFLQPTTECLVYLSEPPYTIVTLREVEIAYLERVMFGLKNFDLVFIFKDHSKAPLHITSIPMSSLEAVKDWLDSMDVLYAESTVNYNWTNIMKTVVEDPVGFYEMGGWSYLQPGGGDGSGDEEDDEDEEEQSSEFEPEDSDEFDEDDDDEDDYSDEDEDDEYSDEEDEEDDEEEEDDSDAPDWDELEEEARREDARRERNESSSGKRRAPPAPVSKSKRR